MNSTLIVINGWVTLYGLHFTRKKQNKECPLGDKGVTEMDSNPSNWRWFS
jgi:hypothetical protein